MRIAIYSGLLACCLAAAQFFPFPGPGRSSAGSGWSKVGEIEIDHTKVGGSDLTDYPVTFSGTYAQLAVVGSGGYVINSSGSVPYDLQFFSNAGATTPLKFEVDKWVSTTGEIVAHAKLPAVSASVNTKYYVAVGKASVTTDQSDKTNVWVDYKNVYHFGDGSTLSGADSSSNGWNLTNSGSTATSGPGNLSGAVNFDGVNDNMVNVSATSSASITVQYWNNVTSGQATNAAAFMYAGTFQTSDHLLALSPFGDNNFYWDFGNATSGQGRVITNYTSFLSAWTHVSLVYKASNNLHAIYLNGSSVASHTSSDASSTQTILSIGNILDVVGTPTFFKGKIDEFRVSSVARDAGWILADYNNQNSPSTFYTVTFP